MGEDVGARPRDARTSEALKSVVLHDAPVVVWPSLEGAAHVSNYEDWREAFALPRQNIFGRRPPRSKLKLCMRDKPRAVWRTRVAPMQEA